MPPALHAIADLVLEDLGEVIQDASGVYHPKNPEKIDPAKIQQDVMAHLSMLASVQASVAALGGADAETEGEWSLNSGSEEIGAGFSGPFDH